MGFLSDGFEHMTHACKSTTGSLTKVVGIKNWMCLAFDTRVAIGNGGGPKGISFRFPGGTPTEAMVGLQWAGPNADRDDPSTWDTSSTSNFKVLLDATLDKCKDMDCSDGPCDNNICGKRAYANGCDACFMYQGFQNGRLYYHWNNANYMGYGHPTLQQRCDGKLMSIIVEGTKFKWYVDNELVAEQGGAKHGPYWVVALLDANMPEGEYPIQQIQPISGLGQAWEPPTTKTTTVSSTTPTMTSMTTTTTTTHMVFISAAECLTTYQLVTFVVVAWSVRA